MNPYKAAINLVRELIGEQHEGDPREDLINQLVDTELKSWRDWITAEDNGLTPQQILNAHEFAFEGGASGETKCHVCTRPADAHILATRRDGKTQEFYVCKSHL